MTCAIKFSRHAQNLEETLPLEPAQTRLLARIRGWNPMRAAGTASQTVDAKAYVRYVFSDSAAPLEAVVHGFLGLLTLQILDLEGDKLTFLAHVYTVMQSEVVV